MQRITLLQNLSAIPAIIADIVASIEEEDFRKGINSEWGSAEVVQHLIYAEPLFRARFKKIISEDNPQLNSFGPDESQHTFIPPKDELLSVFAEQRAETIAFLRSLQPMDWQCTAVHPHVGPGNLRAHVQLMLTHDQEHLNQVRHNHKHHISETIVNL